MDQINSKLHSTNTVKISSRTSVQSEPILSSDGVPSLKLKPVILYPEKDITDENGVFSLEEDKTSAKDFSEATKDGKISTKDDTAEVGSEKLDKTEESVSDKDDTKEDEERKDKGEQDNRKFLAEPKTKIRYRPLSPVPGEAVTAGIGKFNECGFCEQEQNNPKILPCFHSFCRDCLEKLVSVRNGRHWIRCPLCKKRVNLSGKGVDAIEDNTYTPLPNKTEMVEEHICGTCQQEDATYRCSDCQADFCTDCVGKHLRDLPETGHSIKNLTERASVVRPPQELEAFCEVHKTFSLELFCNTCSLPVCGKCAVTNHLNHVTEDVVINSNEKRKHLTGILNDNVTSRILRDLRDNLVSNRREKARISVEIGKLTEEIKQHMEKLKADIEKMGTKLIEELKKNEETWLSSLDKKFQEAESRQRSTEQIIWTARKIIEQAEDVDFIKKYTQLKTAIQNSKKISQPVLQSISCQFIPLSKPGLFGRIKMSMSLKRPVEFYDCGKATFQKRIYSICPTSDSNAWIGHGKVLQLCQKDGKLGPKIELDDMIISIAENSFETIFVACKSVIKVIASKMIPKTCFHLSHEPASIAFNDDDNLIVCYKDARRVSIHSTKGKVIKELDVRHFGYRFGARITDPWRIAVNENQDILVADYSSENIAVFDSSGEMKSTFRCNVFRRAMICCDQGLIFVADPRKDQIYVFSDTGQLLQTVRADGISGLWCMSIDKAGNLWLGSLHGALKIYGRK